MIKRGDRDECSPSGPTAVDTTDEPRGRRASVLRALMNFYESGGDLDQEEHEVDLMIQLSGRVTGSVLTLSGD